MIERFDSALRKVEMARKHTDDLEMEVCAFWDAHPFEVEMVGAPLTGPGSFRVKRMAPVPESIALIAGDAAHNIRSALDHFAWSAVPLNQRGRQTCFPVWSNTSVPTPAKWRKQVFHQLQGAETDLIEEVVKFEPWDTGRDSLLWVINELDRIDKHRLLLTCGAFVHNWSITQHIDVTNPPLHILERMARAYAADMNDETSRQVTFALKAGDLLIRDFPNAKRNENIKFFIEVAIDEPGICEREPLSELLLTSVAKVRQTIKRFSGMY